MNDPSAMSFAWLPNAIAFGGAAIGVAGGLFGTVVGIRNAPAGPQRRFMVNASIIAWIAVLAFVLVMTMLDSAWKWMLFLAYGPLLIGFIFVVNSKLARLRANEEGDADHSPLHPT